MEMVVTWNMYQNKKKYSVNEIISSQMKATALSNWESKQTITEQRELLLA